MWQSIKAQWLFFVSQAKLQLRQVNPNQNSFEIDKRSVPGHVWPSEDTMNMHEVRGWDFSLEVKTQLELTHAQQLTSDLMQTNRDLTGWRHSQINFESVWIFIHLAQLHFCLAYKNSHWAIIGCHTPVILQLGEDKILIYLSKREFWPKKIIIFNLESFFKLFTSVLYTLYLHCYRS